MSHPGRSWSLLKTLSGRLRPSWGSSGAILSSRRLRVADFPWAIRVVVVGVVAGNYGQTPVGGIRGEKQYE